MSITDDQYGVLGRPNGLIRCQDDILKDLLKKNDQNLPFGCTKYRIVPCTNKMPCSTCYYRIGGNNKIARALDIKEELNIDCLMYCKHHLNFWHKDCKNNLKQMFQQELACTAIFAHNVHEGKYAGRVQEGGTGTICFGECTDYVKKVGQDEEGLG
jgi:hypothetical protein